MAKRHIYKKSKNGGLIEVTTRQLTELYEEHEGILASRQYKDLKEMVLVDSSIRGAKWVCILFGVGRLRNAFYGPNQSILRRVTATIFRK